jgi:hypothetical protein
MTRTADSQAVNAKVRPAARALGAKLRDMFDFVASGPMPQHLVDLVDQLERAYEASQTAAGVGEPRALASS